MNRIQPRNPAAPSVSPTAPPAETAAGSPAEAIAGSSAAQGVFSRTGAEKLPLAMFAPLHYERNYAYPLIVWLHGADDSESQLRRIMPQVSLRNYVAIAPRGTVAIAPHGEVAIALRGEVAIALRGAVATGAGLPAKFAWRQTAEQIDAAEQRVLDSLAAAGEKFHVAPERIFLAGCGCGGTMALRIALRQPRRFAGVLSLGGRFRSAMPPWQQLPKRGGSRSFWPAIAPR